MKTRRNQFIYKRYISQYNRPPRRWRTSTAAALALVFSGCLSDSVAFNAFFWLIYGPILLVSAPVLPFYYAAEKAAYERNGLQEANFAPDGKDVVVARLTRKKMHLFLVPLDGSASRQLTNGDRFDFNPVFSPDGRSIVFSSRLGKSKCNLFKLTVDTGVIVPLTQGDHEDWAPQFSPDGSSITFMRRSKDWLPDIYLVDIDGAQEIALTDNEDAYDVGPVFLPDGESILFARLDERPKWSPRFDAAWARRSLFAVSRATRQLTRITADHTVYAGSNRSETNESRTFTSYAGSLIVCESDAVHRLQQMGISMAPMGRWIEELEAFEGCSFSPDGKRAAFARYESSPGESGKCVLRVALTAADHTQVLITKNDRISEPVFSPDGTRLVFRVENEASKSDEFWTMRFDGTDLRELDVNQPLAGNQGGEGRVFANHSVHI